MTWWPEHPDDQWIEVTALGDTEPKFVPGISGAARQVAEAKAAYIHGRIPFETFEAILDSVFDLKSVRQHTPTPH